MKKQILLIDMDGVLADWYKGVMAAMKSQAKWVEQIPYEEILGFNIHEYYPKGAQQDVWNAMAKPGLFLGLEPLPGAIESLKDIEANCQSFIEPRILTAPYLRGEGLTSFTDKALWVQSRLGDWWLERLMMARDKTLVHGDYLIDDKPDISGAKVPAWKQLVYPQPWNKTFRESGARSFVWSQWGELKAELKERSCRLFPGKTRYTGNSQGGLALPSYSSLTLPQEQSHENRTRPQHRSDPQEPGLEQN